MAINKVGVIGAGVMGAGIAAHISNAGVPVVLLDVASKDSDDRSAVASGAVRRLLKTEPAAFMHRRNAKLVTTGNIEDDLGLLADADWVVEAIVERVDIKRGLYERLAEVCASECIVSSNTSTIPLSHLVDGMPKKFTRNFLITHFFNPPRYMRLLEIVAGQATAKAAVERVREFCDLKLGKGVVPCKDTPGFIGNRIGVYWIQCAIMEAIHSGLSVEEADAVVGPPMGIPKTGVFGLSDLIGLDLMPHVLQSMDATLPEDDAFRDIIEAPPMIDEMVANGYTGRKGKGGFYRLRRDGAKRVKEAKDLVTGEYRAAAKVSFDSLAESKREGLRGLVEHPDKGGRYAWRVLSQTLAYAASLVPEITDEIVSVDEAMRLGFNWKYGPFELLDQLGPSWFAQRLAQDEHPVPKLLQSVGDGTFYRVHEGRPQFFSVGGDYADVPRPPGVLLLADIKLAGKPLARNGSASVWDIGDGVLCVEFHSKMNAIDGDIFAMLRKAIELIETRGLEALVIHNDGANFSVGANLGLALYAINIAAWPAVEELVQGGQSTYQALKTAPFPVVGAPSGMALGGGCEVLLHCDALQAHAETYMGLVEVGVGLIPGWGGCKEMLQRWSAEKKCPGGPMPPVVKAFETISVATVARSAEQARDLLFLRPQDGITMNRDRVLADAKARALAMAEDYTPPEPVEIALPGPSAKAAMNMAVHNFKLLGKATTHDEVVADGLAQVLSGGDTDLTETVSTDELLELERSVFMRLIRHPGTIARIEHMLETGKPLRN